MVDYDEFIRQLSALSEGIDFDMTILSNAAALLYDGLPNLNWCGFYLLREDELQLGPFQGKVACTRIPLGKGVCGTAAIRRETVLVPNVHEFPGHIACDSASNSEIVIPIFLNRRENEEPCGENLKDASHSDLYGAMNASCGDFNATVNASCGDLYGVLDIDSPLFERFSEEDRVGLERFVKTLEKCL